MMTLQGLSPTGIAAALLVLPLAGHADGNPGPVALYTPPILAGGGPVECAIVNVGKQTHTVTTTLFDNAGRAVGNSGLQPIPPGVVGGATFGAVDGYCQWLINGPAVDFRAVGIVNHFRTEGSTGGLNGGRRAGSGAESLKQRLRGGD